MTSELLKYQKQDNLENRSFECKRDPNKSIVLIQCLSNLPDQPATRLPIQCKEKEQKDCLVVLAKFPPAEAGTRQFSGVILLSHPGKDMFLSLDWKRLSGDSFLHRHMHDRSPDWLGLIPDILSYD